MARALITACTLLCGAAAQAEVTSAQLTQATGRYDHAILAMLWNGAGCA
jgi:hypothetical protein